MSLVTLSLVGCVDLSLLSVWLAGRSLPFPLFFVWFFLENGLLFVFCFSFSLSLSFFFFQHWALLDTGTWAPFVSPFSDKFLSFFSFFSFVVNVTRARFLFSFCFLTVLECE